MDYPSDPVYWLVPSFRLGYLNDDDGKRV